MILLDTCAVIWDALQPQRLSRAATIAIEEADEAAQLAVCDISWWEIAMLAERGRLQLDVSAAELIELYLKARRVEVIAISPAIAGLSARLGAQINADPADRLIAATALVHKATLVTGDQNLLRSGILKDRVLAC
jgi:PIN domain nuclease of toxin-antitoxin system